MLTLIMIIWLIKYYKVHIVNWPFSVDFSLFMAILFDLWLALEVLL